MILAVLGIPNLGLIAWLVLAFVLAFDAGVCFVGWKHAENRRQRELEDRIVPFRPGPRVIGGYRGPHIEHPTGKERL